MGIQKINIVALRQFRSRVARAKKAGLISRSIDARNVKPSPSLNKKLDGLRDFFKGATPVKVDRLTSTPAQLRELNYRVIQPKGQRPVVLVPHFKDEKVVAKKGLIEFRSDEGYRRIELPKYKGTSLPKYFQSLKKAYSERAPAGTMYGARFFDGRTRLFRSLSDLLKKVAGYKAVRDARGRSDIRDDVLRNFEIVTVPQTPESRLTWGKSGKRKR